jgi:hypothetical protein
MLRVFVWLLRYLRVPEAELIVIEKAPAAFFGTLLVLLIVSVPAIWWVASAHYSERIAVLEAQRAPDGAGFAVLKQSNTELRAELDAIKSEIWTPLSKEELSALATSLKSAHIHQAAIIRPDTPDCARAANQIAQAFVDAGATVEPPFHTIAGEAPGITVTLASSTVGGEIVQTALSKAFGVSVTVLTAQDDVTANRKAVDLMVEIGLKVNQ